MTTIEFVKHRKKTKCNGKAEMPKRAANHHERLGKILSGEITERDRMEVNKPDLIMASKEEMGFIF